MSDIPELQVDDAIQRLYDSVNNPKAWDLAIDATVEATQAIGGIIAVRDQSLQLGLSGEPYNLNVLSCVFRTKQDEMLAYFAQFAEQEEFEMSRLLACNQHDIQDEYTTYSGAEVPVERADFRYRAEQFGIHRRLAARLDDNPRWAEFLFLQFGARHDPIPTSVVDRVRRVIPHVAKAVELGRIFNQLNRRYDAVLTALDKVTIGLCLTNKEGRVLLSNNCAQVLFESSSLVGVSVDGQLTFKDSLLNKKIHAAIDMAVRTANGFGNAEEFLCISSEPQGNRKLLIEVAPTRDSLSEIAQAQGYALISLIDPESDHLVATERLGLIYRLSPSELAVCRLLVMGRTSAQIAAERGVGVETVKTQVRSISIKTSTPSRVDLVRLALRVSPPVAH